jgi:hypothetical protein
MQQDYVNCNHCGASLEVASTTNFVTCGKCGTPLVVRRTGASIYTERVETPTAITTTDLKGAVLTHSETAPPPVHEDELAELQRQNELNHLENQLNRLDLEWERNKEQHMVSGRYGHRYIPQKGSSVGSGVAVAVFGTLWTIFAFGITTGFTWSLSEDVFGPPPIVRVLFPLFGVFFVIFGIGWSMHAYHKADQYEQACRAYQGQRSRLLDQIARVRAGGP